MNSALYSSATAMKSFSEGLGVISNNIANVSTVGYKQQNLQYADLIYAAQGNMGAFNNSEDGSFTAMGQVGLGVQIDSVRTIFSSGGFELTNATTDLAIGGKGFFQVVDDEGNDFYTKAGNFHFDNQGVIRNPQGFSLSGYRIDENGNVGGALGEIQLDPSVVMPPKATTSTKFIANLGLEKDYSNDENNPYFSLAQTWNANDRNDPLVSGSYSYGDSVRAYDEDGTAHNVNIYFDAAPSDPNNEQLKIVEFVVGTNPSDPPVDDKDGLLMMGTLTFDAAGKLVDMSAYTPNGVDSDNILESFSPATFSADGLPQYTLNGKTVTLDLGMSSTSGGSSQTGTAAEVGTDSSKLGTVSPAPSTGEATTAYGDSSYSSIMEQDGYAEGYMSNMQINSQGEVIISYSNNQNQAVYQIPIARFTSEDGLHREGGNLFSAPEEAGLMELGIGGTENYGEVLSHSLELSNVDMSREMVNMIMTQRSFQSSSKAITTADTMLQNAIELKRT